MPGRDQAARLVDPPPSGQRLDRRKPFRALQRPPDGEEQYALRQRSARKRRQQFQSCVSGRAVQLPHLRGQRALGQKRKEQAARRAESGQRKIFQEIEPANLFLRHTNGLHHSDFLPVRLQLRQQREADAEHGDQQQHRAHQQNHQNHHAVRKRIHHANQRPGDGRPVGGQSGIRVCRGERIDVRSLPQQKFDQIFLAARAFQPFIIRCADQKALGGGHHGVHLGIPQKSGDDEVRFPDPHRFSRVQTVLLSVTDGNIDLTGLHVFNHAVLQIHQMIKTRALYADAVVLGAVRQGMTPQRHGTVLQIQKAQNLNLFHLRLPISELEDRRFVDLPGVHLQKVRRLCRFHQRIHRAQQIDGEKAGQREHERADRHEEPGRNGEQGVALQIVPQNSPDHVALLPPSPDVSSARTAFMG